jgi:20S proteasome subunit alpha 1
MQSEAGRFITVFSSDGRLWQVEYAFKAVKQSDVTAVSARSDDFVVVAVQRKVPDKLIDPATVTRMFRVTDRVGACLVGLLTDCLYICRRLRFIAANFQRKNGFEIPVPLLAAALSEIHQLESQYQAIRPTAVSAILFGFEPAASAFALYRVDPAGLASGFRAVAAGVREVEAMAALEKRTEPFASARDATEFVVATLRSVAGAATAADLEVAVLTRERQGYALLPAGEVDDILNAVAGRDAK